MRMKERDKRRGQERMRREGIEQGKERKRGSGGRGRAGGGTKKERKKGQTRFRFRR